MLAATRSSDPSNELAEAVAVPERNTTVLRQVTVMHLQHQQPIKGTKQKGSKTWKMTNEDNLWKEMFKRTDSWR